MRLASFFSPYASKRERIASAVAVLAFALTVAVSSVCVGTSTSIISEPSGRPWLAEWWNGKYATGNWFGLRDTLEDHGLTLGGKWTGLYYGVVDGVKPNIRGSFFDEEIKIHRETQLRQTDRLGTPRRPESIRRSPVARPFESEPARGRFGQLPTLTLPVGFGPIRARTVSSRLERPDLPRNSAGHCRRPPAAPWRQPGS